MQISNEKDFRRGGVLGCAVGVTAGWLIATFPGWVDAWGRDHWWNIATAFGTIGATMAAVAVPLYQNLSRRRDEAAARLRTEWNVAEEVHQLSAKVRDISLLLLGGPGYPPDSKLQHLYSQLATAKQLTMDRSGLLTIGDLLNLVSVAQAEIERRSKETDHMKRATFVMARLQDGALKQELEDCERLHEQTFAWMERLIFEGKRVGMDIPGRN